MHAGTVSRLRFCGDLGDSKIYFKWNVVRFWKSCICSDMLDVQETNFSFAQFNRIRNHLYGCRIEVGRYSRTWFLGSNRRSSWKRLREIKHGWTRLWTNVKFVRHLTQFKNENNLKEWSMILDNADFYSLKRKLLSSGNFVVRVWRQRTSDQDDH